jgi:hypothetical protein
VKFSLSFCGYCSLIYVVRKINMPVSPGFLLWVFNRELNEAVFMSKCDPSSQCCKKKNQQMGIKLEGSQGQVDIRVDLGELVG